MTLELLYLKHMGIEKTRLLAYELGPYTGLA